MTQVYTFCQTAADCVILPPDMRQLRDLTRLRVHWLQDVNRIQNRIGQVCESGNIKVSSVASKLFGVSGRRLLASLVKGNHSAAWMADPACVSLRSQKGHVGQLASQNS